MIACHRRVYLDGNLYAAGTVTGHPLASEWMAVLCAAVGGVGSCKAHAGPPTHRRTSRKCCFAVSPMAGVLATGFYRSQNLLVAGDILGSEFMQQKNS